MPSILAVSGSPSRHSRTVVAVDGILARLADAGYETSHVAVRDLPAVELLSATRDNPAIAYAIDAISRADGIVIATPLYKASYTGLLKAFLDLLPEKALAGKAILPVATGGTIGHLLAIDYALRPVLTALGAGHVVHGRFLLDQDIVRQDDGTGYLTESAEARVAESVAQFVAALPASTLAASALEAPALPASTLAVADLDFAAATPVGV